ncbi:MAG: peptidase, partial [Verrucomicrobiota bacterium]
MMNIFHSAVAVLLGLGTVAFGASPNFVGCEPRGGQLGTTLDVKLTGSQLWDAEEILFHESGIRCLEVKPDEKGGRSVMVKFEITKDAALGEHSLRIRTKSGVSYARRFWVSAFPNVLENGKNNSFDSPQEVAMNVTIDGVTKPETVDYFAVKGKKGQVLSVEVEGIRVNSSRGRLGIDPAVSVLNSERFELASSDDTALLQQDCFVSLVLPKDDQYVIVVRDASYQGNGRYRAHVGSFPRPTAVYPAGGMAGKKQKVRLLGG